MKGGRYCKKNFGGAFLDACPSTLSLLNVKHGLIPHVSPFSYVFYKYNYHIILLKMFFIQIQNERVIEEGF